MFTSIDIAGLSFTYPDGRSALFEINLQVLRGERVALLGPNGAGKSTLLLHLNGILQGSGSIKIAGLPMDRAYMGHIRALVGMVFQSPEDQLFSPTVFEDVAYGPIYQGLPPDVIEERVTTALDAVSMQNYRRRMPHHLSVGEKKRAAVASVLAMQPEILVFDEPTADLDPRARRSLIEFLASLPHTMIIATHDLPLARALLPRTIILDAGRIVADGPTTALLEDHELLLAHGLA